MQRLLFIVGPVRHQVVTGHAQGVDAVFQLLDDVLLVAALVGKKTMSAALRVRSLVR